MLISFSGLDGSGKTTLIMKLKKVLEDSGRSVAIRTMYGDLSLYALLRHIRDAFRPPPQGTPVRTGFNLIPNSPKVDVSDKKNRLSRFFYRIFRGRTCRRLSLFCDILVVSFYRLMDEGVRGRILLTDRYLYDSLADSLDFEDRDLSYVRFFLKCAPQPDLAVFVDVPPQTAFDRKREYPLVYLAWRRQKYLEIFHFLKRSKILNNTLELERSVQILKESLC